MCRITSPTKWELDQAEIGLDDAVKVARALGRTLTEIVGKIAPRRDGHFDEIAGIYRLMSDEGRNALLAIARGLASMYPGNQTAPRVNK